MRTAQRRTSVVRQRRPVLVTAAAVSILAALAPATAATSARPRTPFEIKLINGLDAGEPQLAVDPVHHTVAISFLLQTTAPGVSHCGLATSRDHGSTWRVRFKNPADPVPSRATSCSDPIAATGAGGAMYVGALWGGPAEGTTPLDTFVSRSTDGGTTWGPSTYATGNRDVVKNEMGAPNAGTADRPWLTADARTGTVYAYMGNFAPKFRRWIVASHDQGRTFGPPRAITSNAAPEWLMDDFRPAAAYGVLAVGYVSAGVDPDCLCRNVFETSTDDGATWRRHPAPLPATWTVADPSHRGRFAIMTGGEDTLDSQGDPNELLVSVTSDFGKTWSPPVHIGEAPANPRYSPWIAYSPKGVLGVSYRTKYGTTSCLHPLQCNNTSYAMWAAISADGGYRFSPPIRISHAESPAQIDSGTGFAAGDDFGTVALDDKYLYVAWGDMRKNSNSSAPGEHRSLYFGRLPLPTPRTPQTS